MIIPVITHANIVGLLVDTAVDGACMQIHTQLGSVGEFMNTHDLPSRSTTQLFRRKIWKPSLYINSHTFCRTSQTSPNTFFGLRNTHPSSGARMVLQHPRPPMQKVPGNVVQSV